MSKDKLVVYDFDGTLFNSPDRLEGEAIYVRETGQNLPFKGWWGKIESLSPPFVPQSPAPEHYNLKVLATYFENKKDSRIILMTGRPYKLRHRVEEILAAQGFQAESYYYRIDSNRHIVDIKSEYIESKEIGENIKSIEIYEDQKDNITKFIEKAQQWKDSFLNLEKVTIHDALSDLIYII